MAKSKSIPANLPPSGAKDRKVEPMWLPIDRIVPNAWNPNSQSEAVYELLKDEIAENGNLSPIQVVPLDDGTYRIIGGEHRWRASKELGEEEILCVVLKDSKWAEQDLQKFVTVRLNVIHGKLDSEKFLALYKELSEKYGAESMQRMLGYADAKGFQRMLGWVKKGLKQSLPKEMAQEIEEATKEVKSVADLGNVIQDIFNRYGDTLAQNFMVFDYGKQQHIYITTTAKMRRSLDRLMEYCRIAKKDINEVMQPIVEDFAKKASLELDKINAKPTDDEVEKVEW